jgi:hypothetical protein
VPAAALGWEKTQRGAARPASPRSDAAVGRKRARPVAVFFFLAVVVEVGGVSGQRGLSDTHTHRDSSNESTNNV